MGIKPIAFAILLSFWGLSGCSRTTTANHIPESDDGYFGIPGRFYIAVDTGAGDRPEAFVSATETLKPGHDWGKFGGNSYSEHEQRCNVFVKLRLDTTVGILKITCVSLATNEYHGPPFAGTSCLWSWTPLSPAQLVSIRLATYALNADGYESPYYSFRFENYLVKVPLQPASDRLQPWTLPSGDTRIALVGPNDSARTDTTSPVNIRVRQTAFAKDAGFLGAVVEYWGADSVRKILKLNRILPKP